MYRHGYQVIGVVQGYAEVGFEAWLIETREDLAGVG